MGFITRIQKALSKNWYTVSVAVILFAITSFKLIKPRNVLIDRIHYSFKLTRRVFMIFQSILRFLRPVGNQNIQGEEAEEQQNTKKRSEKKTKANKTKWQFFFSLFLKYGKQHNTIWNKKQASKQTKRFVTFFFQFKVYENYVTLRSEINSTSEALQKRDNQLISNLIEVNHTLNTKVSLS